MKAIESFSLSLSEENRLELVDFGFENIFVVLECPRALQFPNNECEEHLVWLCLYEHVCVAVLSRKYIRGHGSVFVVMCTLERSHTAMRGL